MRRFLITTLAIIVMSSGLCPHLLTTQALFKIPAAQAMNMDMSKEHSMQGEQLCHNTQSNSQMSCCLNKATRETNSALAVKTTQQTPEVDIFLHQDIGILSDLQNFLLYSSRNFQQNYHSPPLLTGIIVKKE